MKISKDNINNCKILNYSDLTNFYYIRPYISYEVQMCFFNENLSILKEIFPSYMIHYQKSEKDPYIFILADKKDYDTFRLNVIKEQLNKYNVSITLRVYDIPEQSYKDLNSLIRNSIDFSLPWGLKYCSDIYNLPF